MAIPIRPPFLQCMAQRTARAAVVCAWAAIGLPALAQVAITDPPVTHNFGNIAIGSTYATQYFSVFNQGQTAVTLGQVVVEPPALPDLPVHPRRRRRVALDPVHPQDDMGGAAAGRLTAAGGVAGTTPGAAGGSGRGWQPGHTGGGRYWNQSTPGLRPGLGATAIQGRFNHPDRDLYVLALLCPLLPGRRAVRGGRHGGAHSGTSQCLSVPKPDLAIAGLVERLCCACQVPVRVTALSGR